MGLNRAVARIRSVILWQLLGLCDCCNVCVFAMLRASSSFTANSENRHRRETCLKLADGHFVTPYLAQTCAARLQQCSP
jgi:hypothetical protein